MLCSRKHVFRDLRPYVCLWPTCVSPGQEFKKRKDWVSHMTQEHWRQWDCPFGCSAKFDDSRALEDHLKRTHSGELLADRAGDISVRSSRTDDAQARGECPLCCNFEVKSVSQYASHVGHHLEQLALFVLPNTHGSQAKDEDDGQNDHFEDQNKISCEPNEPNVDNGDTPAEHIEAHTLDTYVDPGLSSGERRGEEVSAETSTAQISNNSEQNAQHGAEQLLLSAGINPSLLNPEQFATFHNQSPIVQQKAIETYLANLQKGQRQQGGKDTASYFGSSVKDNQDEEGSLGISTRQVEDLRERDSQHRTTNIKTGLSSADPMLNANDPPRQGSPMAPEAPDEAIISHLNNAELMAAIPPGVRNFIQEVETLSENKTNQDVHTNKNLDKEAIASSPQDAEVAIEKNSTKTGSGLQHSRHYISSSKGGHSSRPRPEVVTYWTCVSGFS